MLCDNKLLTACCYNDSSRKTVLFPVNTVDGITVTRSYPVKNVAGKKTDHPEPYMYLVKPGMGNRV